MLLCVHGISANCRAWDCWADQIAPGLSHYLASIPSDFHRSLPRLDRGEWSGYGCPRSCCRSRPFLHCAQRFSNSSRKSPPATPTVPPPLSGLLAAMVAQGEGTLARPIEPPQNVIGSRALNRAHPVPKEINVRIRSALIRLIMGASFRWNSDLEVEGRNDRLQLRGVDRFLQDLRYLQLLGLNLDLLARFSADDDDGDAGMKSPADTYKVPPAYVNTMNRWKVEVDDGDLESALLHLLDGLPAISGGLDLIPLSQERLPQSLPAMAMIIHHQDSLRQRR